jgi:hypothetical protein
MTQDPIDTLPPKSADTELDPRVEYNVTLTDIRIALNLSDKRAQFLELLLKHKNVTNAMVAERLMSYDAKQMAYRLKGLLPWADCIKSQHGLGYWLDPETKELLLDKVRAYFTKVVV